MIQHLSITHYALIEHLDIDFHRGFSVITGETGAGKSIMLGALSLLLGGRADAKLIRRGERKLTVEATFSLEGMALQAWFEAHDLDYDSEQCILRREVTDNGKSRAFINDSPVAAARLKELGAFLIDIHSQHQNVLLADGGAYLLDFIDAIAARPDVKAAYRRAHEDFVAAQSQLRRLREQADRDRADREYLAFQLSRLDEAALQEGEQEELEAEQRLLSNAEEIKGAFYRVQGLLSNDELDVASLLRQAADSLGGVSEALPEAGSLAERLSSLEIELSDVCTEIDRHSEKVQFEPARLAFIDERLSTIYELLQKHHVTSVTELLVLQDNLRSRLSAIDNSDEDLERLAVQLERLEVERLEAAAVLTAVRREAADRIADHIVGTLRQLGMPHVSFSLDLLPLAQPAASGANQAVCLFSANKNIPPQDLSQVASGGEIARVMLSLKALYAEATALPTIIFDEIDTGVSGTMAERMAQIMQQMAAHCQVICITHLPQIAALGAHHYRVYKDDEGKATRSHLTMLSAEERVEEVAHMLSGETISSEALANARRLLGMS